MLNVQIPEPPPQGSNQNQESVLFYFIYLFIYFWLCWVFVSVRGLSPVAASGGHSSSRCAGLSLLQPLLLRSTGSRRTGSVVVAHGPSRSAACGIFPDQGSNPCSLHWQADSQPLRHQGSPQESVLTRALGGSDALSPKPSIWKLPTLSPPNPQPHLEHKRHCIHVPGPL